jgi:1-acyl-sn-glycerol-3-phosphate acyltransferase
VLARGFELVFDRVKNLLLADIHWRIPSDLAQRMPSDRPVLLFGNHVSNWDGFLYRDLQKKLRPGVPIYSLMLERELERLPLFRALGGIGIDPASSSSVARAVRATQALRGEHGARKDFFFSVFPQGSTFPAAKRPLGFQEGVRHFARALGPVTLLPVALQFEWLGSLRPQVWITVGEPLAVGENGDVPALAVFEASVTELLDRTHAELCTHGEAAKGSEQSNGVGGSRA